MQQPQANLRAQSVWQALIPLLWSKPPVRTVWLAPMGVALFCLPLQIVSCLARALTPLLQVLLLWLSAAMVLLVLMALALACLQLQAALSALLACTPLPLLLSHQEPALTVQQARTLLTQAVPFVQTVLQAFIPQLS